MSNDEYGQENTILYAEGVDITEQKSFVLAPNLYYQVISADNSN
jgi:hypothetical protein